MAILGVLATAVAVYLRPQRTVMDCATVMADAVREAARRAFARGPVRADVVTALGITHRTRVRIAGDNVTVDELVEDVVLGSATWSPIRTARVIMADAQSDFTGWKAAAQLDDGTSANFPAIDADMTTLDVRCFPSGICDGATVYFAGPNGTTARTIVMPLGGAVLARRGL
mgnify:CR=1 FL=1